MYCQFYTCFCSGCSVALLTGNTNFEVYRELLRRSKIYIDSNKRLLPDLRRGQGCTGGIEKTSQNGSNLLLTATFKTASQKKKKKNEIKSNWLLPSQICIYSFKPGYINVFQKIYYCRTKWYCTSSIKNMKNKNIKKLVAYLLAVTIIKNYIKDGRLYLDEGQNGGAFGAIAASLIPSLIGPIAKLFGRKKRRRRKY